jgi:hypothetical protein
MLLRAAIFFRFGVASMGADLHAYLSSSVDTSDIMVQIMAKATTGPPPNNQAKEDAQSLLADRRGRKSTICLSIPGFALNCIIQLVVMWRPDVFPLRTVWALLAQHLDEKERE